MFYLFVYGILRSCNNSEQVKKMKSFSSDIITVRLDGYSLFISKNGFTPTIYRTSDSYDFVCGELYCCDTKKNFDELLNLVESFAGNEFEKTTVNIHSNHKFINAHSYITTDIDNFVSCDYHDYFDYLKNKTQ